MIKCIFLEKKEPSPSHLDLASNICSGVKGDEDEEEDTAEAPPAVATSSMASTGMGCLCDVRGIVRFKFFFFFIDLKNW